MLSWNWRGSNEFIGPKAFIDQIQRCKHQDPRSRETPSTKIQDAVWHRFGPWLLELLWILDLGAWIFSCRLFAVHAAKDQKEFVGFSVKHPGFFGELRFRSYYHAQKELRLFRLFYAAAYWVAKILFRNALIGFAIIGTHAGSTADQLADQTIVCWPSRNLL